MINISRIKIWKNKLSGCSTDFRKNGAAQVQIINSSGRILQDFNGLSQDHNKITPLRKNDQTIGVVRFVTSLTDHFRGLHRVELKEAAEKCAKATSPSE